jgi:hypothetical protein
MGRLTWGQESFVAIRGLGEGCRRQIQTGVAERIEAVAGDAAEEVAGVRRAARRRGVAGCSPEGLRARAQGRSGEGREEMNGRVRRRKTT